ncbi:hypothetical protein AX769_16055 [Frondihabitans sp. PAMC 28766]|uniref:hypothetical protein n=1 Tax=Frondihabitans sp. PAMC 28766 TaxID=1795630 RepID=UPI00078D6586|nr:hypothetical protein [Frondihabitans sp. PAMC 28766]AMM21366.1 hypothetical protein AX769_16055 [Frondihabitans sp. PAMC 28766]
MPTFTPKRLVIGALITAVVAAGIAVPTIASATTAAPGATTAASAAATATAAPTATPTATTPVTTGTLKLLTTNPVAGQPVTFGYSTDKPLDLDWVGLYNTPANGPTDQKYHAGSTAYTYTKDAATGDDASGTITVSGSGLTTGHDITAYFLYDDGYTWLAQPVTFQVAAAPVPTDTGTLSLDTKNPIAGQPLTFSYSTTTPLALNWVGLYNNPADGPTGQKYNNPSTAYTYTGDNTSGTLTVSGAGLTSGHDITAYFLYNDGYTWLAKPVTFQVSDPPPYDPTPTTAHFVTDDVTEASTPPVTALDTSVKGLWFGPGGAAPTDAVTFAKTAGSSWLKVSAAGVITGTTPTDPKKAVGGEGTVTIIATDVKGITGTITIEFPLSAKNAQPALKTATLNMWDGGSHVADSSEKLVDTILTNRLDVVGLQSTLGTQATAVAKLLGWGHVESAGGQAIISRYPLAPANGAVPTGVPAVSAVANIDGSRVQLWSAQLDSDSFGPAAACAALASTSGTGTGAQDAAAIVATEKATLRYRQAQTLAKAIAKTESKSVPSILLADLESPAATDWTATTAASHCGIRSVNWPVPLAFTGSGKNQPGLTDSYRAEYPNAAKDSGQTTSIFPPVTGTSSTTVNAAKVDAATAAGTSATATSTTDGPERLDFVDYAGKLTVTESHTLVDGFPVGPTDPTANAWISDRAAVVTTFTVK